MLIILRRYKNMDINFYIVHKQMAKDIGIGPACLFGWLATVCNLPSGVCTASQQTMARELGLSTRSVRRYLDKLYEQGLIDVVDKDVSGTDVITIPEHVHAKLEFTVKGMNKKERKTPDVPPEILQFRSITGRYPTKAQWPRVQRNLRGLDTEVIRKVYEIWTQQTTKDGKPYSMFNPGWTDWVKQGVPEGVVIEADIAPQGLVLDETYDDGEELF
jgi:DNA-binding Lrp family transcriptional regulator